MAEPLTMGSHPGPRVILNVLEEHFDELDFLWEQRERIVFAHDRMLGDLLALEERAEAHLDGLRIGGDHSRALARSHIADEQIGAATAAALTLLSLPSEDSIGEVFAALPTAPAAAQDGIRIALRHVDPRAVADPVYELSVGKSLNLRALAADVLAFHRLRPPPEMDRLLGGEDPAAVRLAYAASGRFGSLSRSELERALSSPDPQLRWIALEAAARCRLDGLRDVCRKEATGRKRVPEAVTFLGVIGQEEDLAVLKEAVDDRAVAREALDGMGRLGAPAAIPILLRAMEVSDLAEHAAAAFTRITGVEDIRAMPPPGAPEGVESQASEAQPPDPAKALARYGAVRERLSSAARWQWGVDLPSPSPMAVMDRFPLAVRRDVYLSARLAGAPDIELEGRGGGSAHLHSPAR